MGGVNDVAGVVTGRTDGVNRHLGVGGIGVTKGAAMAGETVAFGNSSDIVAVGS